MTVSAQYAQEHLEELLDSADRGEEVEIAREGKPPAKLFVVPAPAQPQPAGPRKLGMGRGTLPPDFDAQWRKMKEEDERDFANDSLLATGEI